MSWLVIKKYALKQAPFLWNRHITSIFKTLGLQQLPVDFCLFIVMMKTDSLLSSFMLMIYFDLLKRTVIEFFQRFIKKPPQQRISRRHSTLSWRWLPTKQTWNNNINVPVFIYWRNPTPFPFVRYQTIVISFASGDLKTFFPKREYPLLSLFVTCRQLELLVKLEPNRSFVCYQWPKQVHESEQFISMAISETCTALFEWDYWASFNSWWRPLRWKYPSYWLLWCWPCSRSEYCRYICQVKKSTTAQSTAKAEYIWISEVCKQMSFFKTFLEHCGSPFRHQSL